MARYTGPVCRLCRREKGRLHLKGARCYSNKCAVEKRENPPGELKKRGSRKLGDFGLQLRAKQKARRLYGVLEQPFRNYFHQAVREPGVTGENLLRHLERRLDNVVFRLGWSVSRAQARQLVQHRHIAVNGRVVDIPSYQVSVGDVVTVREKSRHLEVIRQAMELAEGRGVPGWLRMDASQFRGEVVNLPVREEMEMDIEDHLIVEFYSR